MTGKYHPSFGVVIKTACSAKKRGPPKGYIDALEKRIQSLEEILSERPTSETNSQASTPIASRSPTEVSRQDSTPSGKKRPQGASSDRVQYLGDMSTLQFLSKKIHLDGSNDIELLWKGRRIRKFGNQVVLVKDDGDKTSPYPPLLPGLFQQTGIRQWIYSVSGADQYTTDRLLRV